MKTETLGQKNVPTCSPREPLSRAAELMLENDCAAVAVIDDEGRTISTLTERDLCMTAFAQDEPLSRIPVSQAIAHVLVSSPPEEVVGSDQPPEPQRVPLLDGEGRPIGAVDVGRIAPHLHAGDKPDGLSTDPIARTLAALAQPHVAPPMSRRPVGARARTPRRAKTSS